MELKTRCGTCKYYGVIPSPPGEIRTLHGCFFNPPTLHMIPTQTGIGVQPLRPFVTANEFCHNHDGRVRE